jgi:hypothetical protein
MQRYKCNSGFPDPTGSYVWHAEAQEIIATLTQRNEALAAEAKWARKHYDSIQDEDYDADAAKQFEAARAHTDSINALGAAEKAGGGNGEGKGG